MNRIKCIFLVWLASALVAGAQWFGSVGLKWDANAEPDVVKYRVYRGTASGQYDWSQDVGLVTQARVDGLSAATTYFFAVTAWNDAQLESLPSNEVSYSVPGGGAATAITGWESERTHTEVTMTWDPAPTDQGPVRWRVQWGLRGEPPTKDEFVYLPGHQFPTADMYTAYEVTITPESLLGFGPSSVRIVKAYPRPPMLLRQTMSEEVWQFQLEVVP